MSDHKEHKYGGKTPFVALNTKIVVDGKEVLLRDSSDHFLAYVAGSQLREAEIAAFDVPANEDPFFEVVSNKPMTCVVRVSQASFDAIKRARPIIDIVKA